MAAWRNRAVSGGFAPPHPSFKLSRNPLAPSPRLFPGLDRSSFRPIGPSFLDPAPPTISAHHRQRPMDGAPACRQLCAHDHLNGPTPSQAIRRLFDNRSRELAFAAFIISPSGKISGQHPRRRPTLGAPSSSRRSANPHWPGLHHPATIEPRAASWSAAVLRRFC